MSYILDALKRAESERSRGVVPGLHAQTASSGLPSGSGGMGRWLSAGVGAAVVLALVAVGGWGWSVFRPMTERSVPRVAATPPIAPTAPQVRSTVSAPVPPASPQQVTAAAGTVPPAAAPLEPAQAVTERPLASRAAEPRARPAATADAVARPAAMVASAASAALSSERIYTLAELPADIRSQLPSLTVGGATYSESPASRMLILNGQLYHEGDRLAPELTLQQIQLRRAVLSFRGYRYALSY